MRWLALALLCLAGPLQALALERFGIVVWQNHGVLGLAWGNTW